MYKRQYVVYVWLRSPGFAAMLVEFTGTDSAQPSASFLNSGTLPGATRVRYATWNGSSRLLRVNTSSQRAVPPLLPAASTTNQRGQPAFFGIVNFASVSFSGVWFGLPPGLFFWPAFRRAESMSARAPVVCSASREAS